MTAIDVGLIIVAACRVRGCTCEVVVVLLAPTVDDDLTAGTLPFRVQHEPDCQGNDRPR